MNTKNSLLKCLATGSMILSLTMEVFGAKYVAHEWGTFTSVQGGDGVLLEWRPLETSRLPDFVYDWSKPGLGRVPTLNLAGPKGAMITRQRMETPVIYFYADDELSVNVSVRFPQGLITEWYPQASQVGPSTSPLLPQHGVKDSRIAWSGVTILPAGQNEQVAQLVPHDKSGSHYFAARDTDAALVRVNSIATTNSTTEHEKYLFYRGVGNFATPLRVTMTSNEILTITNNGTEPLPHLFLLRLHEGRGEFIHLDRLAPRSVRAVSIRSSDYPQPTLARKLAEQMAAALTSEGLYPREAEAMVKTWEDSWFAEDGVRVLYVLPRPWTDRTLPLELDPSPHELVRVMVGRAEIITPEVESGLRDRLARANAGDAQARALAVADLKGLGRFAEPAIRRALRGVSDPELNQMSSRLLQEAFKPSPPSAL